MKSTILFFLIALYSMLIVAQAQSALPFTRLSQLRVFFKSVTTDLKLNIFKNVYTSLKCAPNVTVSYTAKENSYISYYTIQWMKGSSNVYYNKVDVGQYLYTGQTYTITQKIATFNCQYGGHPELAFMPGQYSFVLTLYDNNRRSEIIGKISFTDNLQCVSMSSGCWAYSECDYYSNTCDSFADDGAKEKILSKEI